MKKTIRLFMPQWQGGNNPDYFFGASLLKKLIPANTQQKEITIEIEYRNDRYTHTENELVKEKLLEQLETAANVLEIEQPDVIITLGGDCAVSQAPFTYLMEKYGDDLGVLWIDAHPDISTPDMNPNEHAMVLGNLLGKGDPLFAEKVKTPLHPKQIMYAGLQTGSKREEEIISELSLAKTTPKEMKDNNDKILKWIDDNQFKYVTVHFDLDALDPQELFSLRLMPNSGTSAVGELRLNQVNNLLNEVSEKAEIVGLTIAEFLPHHIQRFSNFLDDMKILK